MYLSDRDTEGLGCAILSLLMIVLMVVMINDFIKTGQKNCAREAVVMQVDTRWEKSRCEIRTELGWLPLDDYKNAVFESNLTPAPALPTRPPVQVP